MSNFPTSEKTLQRIASYCCAEEYCSLRLVNHATKAIMDKLLPNGPGQRRESNQDLKQNHLLVGWKRMFLRRCGSGSGLRLLDREDYLGWKEAMEEEFGSVMPMEEFGNVMQVFCEANFDVVDESILYILCRCNRREYVWKLWKEKRLFPGCLKSICLLDDCELLKRVLVSFKGKVTRKMIVDALHRCFANCCYHCTRFLYEKYPKLQKRFSLKQCLWVAVCRNRIDFCEWLFELGVNVNEMVCRLSEIDLVVGKFAWISIV